MSKVAHNINAYIYIDAMAIYMQNRVNVIILMYINVMLARLH